MSQAQALKIAVDKQRQARDRRHLIRYCQCECDETAQRQAQALYHEAVRELVAWAKIACKSKFPQPPKDDVRNVMVQECGANERINALREHVGL